MDAATQTVACCSVGTQTGEDLSANVQQPGRIEPDKIECSKAGEVAEGQMAPQPKQMQQFTACDLTRGLQPDLVKYSGDKCEGADGLVAREPKEMQVDSVAWDMEPGFVHRDMVNLRAAKGQMTDDLTGLEPNQMQVDFKAEGYEHTSSVPRLRTGLRRGFLLGQRGNAMDQVVGGPPLVTAGFEDTGQMPGLDGKAWQEKAFPVPDAVTFKAGDVEGPSSASFWDSLVGPAPCAKGDIAAAIQFEQQAASCSQVGPDTLSYKDVLEAKRLPKGEDVCPSAWVTWPDALTAMEARLAKRAKKEKKRLLRQRHPAQEKEEEEDVKQAPAVGLGSWLGTSKL